MINRILIRIKVLQIVYSHYQNDNKDLKAAETELQFSLRKSYDLYHYLLLLIVELTTQQKQNIATRKAKFRPSYEEMNPNERFINNRFATQVQSNQSLQKYVAEQGISWSNDTDFIKSTLETVLNSPLYADYINNPVDNYEVDKEFWKNTFKKLICNNDDIYEYLEDKSIYWNDDIEIVETFVLKSIKRFQEEAGATQELLPMYKDKEDLLFATKLFRQTLLKSTELRERINKHLKNWETERIANMDLVILQVALAEIMTFPSIPVNVTLNEYIDNAKCYSTPKSGNFVNGVLDSIIKELKSENLLLKN